MAHSKRATLLRQRPVGVFDSGVGGLTIVREIRKCLPGESIVYFGDIARLPYGIKSREQIRRFSVQNMKFLLRHKVKAAVVACNSSSSAAFEYLRSRFSVPIVDVIGPAVQAALSGTQTGRIGVIGTRATIDSGAYQRRLRYGRRGVRVFTKPCPLFVPLVEEGWIEGGITDRIIRSYVLPLKKKKIDTLILGCTHYPLLKDSIRKAAGEKILLIDSAAPTVATLSALLKRKELDCVAEHTGRLRIYVSDLPRNFLRLGKRFLAEPMSHVRLVR